jgi:uncharacterized cupin superfamily protein
MDKVRIEDIAGQIDSATVKRPLTDALNTADVAFNYYELAPGDSFAYGYHMHENQEEIFVVQEGQVTFETEDGEIAVSAGEVIRFAPGEYQQGINRDDERVVAVAIGAPQETGESEILRRCDACGERTPNTVERAEDGQAKITRCLDCGNETGRFN